jgi:TetR/AcrR family transcriptional regulator, repressor for neighboring sulfatase
MKSEASAKAAAKAVPGKRARRAPEEARRLILDAAQALIARTGPEGLRLQDIAAAAGISHPLIIHHFGSRAGLVRALTRGAADELKDKLIGAMAETGFAVEDQLDRVFEAFRGGLAQRLVWLATVDPIGDESASTMIEREIADHIYAHRIANAPPGANVRREEIDWLVHLVAIAAIGDALYGAPLWRSAGIAAGPETDRRFRAWLARMIQPLRQQP